MDTRKVGDFNENREMESNLRSLSNLGHHDMNHCLPTAPGQGSPPQETHTGPSLESSSATTFPLLRLPPELRQLIYEPLIVIGDLSVMRINKLVHNEAVNVFSKSAVLRLAFRYSDRKASPWFPVKGIFHLTGFLELRATSAIQRVELHFNLTLHHLRTGQFNTLRHLRTGQFNKYTNMITCLGGRTVARQWCTIYLDFGGCLTLVADPCSPLRGCLKRLTEWQAITRLIGFNTLNIRIRYDKDLNQEEDEKTWLLACYRLFLTLGTTLGPAVLDMSVDTHCLRFHPRSFKAKPNVEMDNRFSCRQG